MQVLILQSTAYGVVLLQSSSLRSLSVPGPLLSISVAWAPASAASPTRRKSRTPPPTGASAVTDVTEHGAPKRSPQRSDVVWFGVLRAAHVAGSYPQLGAKGEGMEAL